MNQGGRKLDNAQKAAVPMSNYQFDFGLNLSGNQAPKSLKDQRNNNLGFNQALKPESYSSWQSSTSNYNRPQQPSWTHQPASSARPASSGSHGWTSSGQQKPPPMAGDILGKSWVSSSDSSVKTHNNDIGIVGGLNKGAAPHLFGDLFGEALAKQKSNSSSSSSSSAFSMGSLASALPKSGVSLMDQRAQAVRSAKQPAQQQQQSAGQTMDDYFNSLPTFKNSSSAQVSSPDPFGSFVGSGTGGGFHSKKMDDGFGEFQKGKYGSGSGSRSAASGFGSSSGSDPFSASINASANDFGFAGPTAAPKTTANTSNYASKVSADPFDSLNQNFSSGQQQKGSDPIMDSLFQSSSSGSKPVSDTDDWGVMDDFGTVPGDSGTTTELEGLPPPPSGVTVSIAKNKGMENYKQGQYADAIKWLTWAAVLLEKSADDGNASAEILTCRASCYKEVGEYKKAIADCSTILEKDTTNASVLLQRALLYESNEKYKLGVADLRSVLKIDPTNRLAKNTLSRLVKMVD